MKTNRESNIAMIPVRIGSQRLKWKNLVLIKNKPLLYYAIQAAKNSKKFDEIYINSDCEIFEKIAKKYKVKFYLRPKKLGKSDIHSDDVVYDFIKNINCDKLFWINSIAPLQNYIDISSAFENFIKSNKDSFFTVQKKNVHGIYKNKPINYLKNRKFHRTQDLKPFSEIDYNIMAWKTKKFISEYKKNKYAFFCGSTLFHNSPKKSNIIIKTKEDIEIVKLFFKDYSKKITYDKVIKLL